MSDPHARFDGPPAREKMFNAPLAVVAITLALPVLFFFQERLPDLGAGMAFGQVMGGALNQGGNAGGESNDPFAALERLADLAKRGVITQADFDAKKAELLKRIQ